MGFGNPYGDEYNEDIVYKWTNALHQLGVSVMSLADTVGLATPEQVERITRHVIQSLPEVEIGVHLHSSPEQWKEKTEAALRAGCFRFDSAIKGIGGCPMAGNTLIGNMDTEKLIAYFNEKSMLPIIQAAPLNTCIQLANQVFV